MKIVIITTGQPSVNPRVVKEADALSAKGFDVTVLFCFWIQWASDADKTLLSKVKWHYVLVGGQPDKNRLLYYHTKARFKVNAALNKRIGNRFLFAERAQARCFDELLQTAKSIKADWYIAHNLGALAVATTAATFHSAASGFDFEDYHRAENTQLATYKQKRIVYLEQKYIPSLSYITTSSPLITKHVKIDFPAFSKPLITILNCFPITQQTNSGNPSIDNKILHLFWFSQTVGANRGLELVVHALKKINNPSIHLTLAGRCDDKMEAFIKQNAGGIKGCIHLAGIIQPEALPAFAASFDVGLATELNTPLNRNICLTNKIFTYLIAGICILASDTDAQKDFMSCHKGIGLLYKNDDVDQLAAVIKLLYFDKVFLQQCKDNSRLFAKNEMNWEMESQKLVSLLLNK